MSWRALDNDNRQISRVLARRGAIYLPVDASVSSRRGNSLVYVSQDEWQEARQIYENNSRILADMDMEILL